MLETEPQGITTPPDSRIQNRKKTGLISRLSCKTDYSLAADQPKISDPSRFFTDDVFERCGGFAVVRKVVSAFYDKVLDSPILEPHFENIDMRRLIDHQTKFIASAMGGPASFSDDMLTRVHEPLGITKPEFDEMARLFRDALEDAGLEDADIDQVHNEILIRESLVVTRSA